MRYKNFSKVIQTALMNGLFLPEFRSAFAPGDKVRTLV
jgi:hypothetical protein